MGFQYYKFVEDNYPYRVKMKRKLLIFLVVFSSVTLSHAQTPSRYNLSGKIYPLVNKDNSVTFTFYAPSANAVVLSLGRDYMMKRDKNGIWSVTSDPLVEGFHYYSLKVGGLSFADPSVYTFYGTGRYSGAMEVPENEEDRNWYICLENIFPAERCVLLNTGPRYVGSIGACMFTRLRVTRKIRIGVIRYSTFSTGAGKMKQPGQIKVGWTIFWIT